jgi:sulfur-carrier protein adenylyltransferase/sulfurtransferase
MGPEERQRYARQLMMPEIGIERQQRLAESKVLCIGAGGLGSPAAMYLAAAGVGTLGLVDFDVVDVSNLQRQILHGTPDVGRSKLDSARDRLSALNPHVRLELHDGAFDESNALDLVGAYDVVIDGTDNFPTRYLVNDACVMAGTPNAYGSIFRFEGQASVFAAPGGPCFRCLHPEPPPAGVIPSCAEAGVLGVVPGIIGCIQATEAIKMCLGIGEPLVGRFLIYDALRMRFREIRLPRDPDCPVCGLTPSITTLSRYDEHCTAGLAAGWTSAISVAELRARLASAAPPLLLDVREPVELEICRLAGAAAIPLGELPRRVDELPRDTDIVVFCKSGVRSERAAAHLRERGYSRTRSLAGGILRWIEEVDPSLRRY